MLRKTIRLRNPHGEEMHVDIKHREDVKDTPAIIILHGFKGFKDWGFFPEVGERLAEAGYVAVTPNFSRNGIGFDISKFDRLDLFAKNTISHELQDVRTVLDAIKDGTIARKVADINRIGLLGHSRGGGTALLAAREWSNEIECLVTWASVSSFFRFSDEQIEQWKKKGVVEIENARTGQMMPIEKSFWEDLEKNKKKFDLHAAAEELEMPALFVHGDQDTSVSPAESEQLHEKCGSYVKRLEIIEEADHTFGIKHPMERTSVQFDNLTSITENWYDNYLNI